MNKTISALHFDWTDIEHCFARVAGEFGLDGIEFSFLSTMERPHCTVEDVKQIRAAAERYGLKALTVHVWEDPARLGPVAAPPLILRWLEGCVYTGIGGMVMHGGTYPDREAGLRRVRKVVENVIGRFEKENVVLHLENMRGVQKESGWQLLSQAWEFREVLGAIDSPALRCCLDTGHANISGNIEELVREFGPRLSHIHLHDNRGREDEHLAYREGTADWDALFTLLKETGFDGTFCVEFPVRGGMEPFRRCVQDIRARFGA